jgi:hypothetical protein
MNWVWGTRIGELGSTLVVGEPATRFTHGPPKKIHLGPERFMRKSVLGRARADLGLDQPIADGHGTEKNNRRDLFAGVGIRAQETPDGGRAFSIVGFEGLDPKRNPPFEVCRQPAFKLDAVARFPVTSGGLRDDLRDEHAGARTDQCGRGKAWSSTHSGE